MRARHPFTIRMKTGARRDGTLVARETELLLDGGAYGDDSPGVLGYALLMSCGPYRIPHVHAHGRVAYTNKLRFGAFRGFGVPQVTFAVANSSSTRSPAAWGWTRSRLRRRNMLAPGDPWFGGQAILSNGLAECLDIVERESGWHAAAERCPTTGGPALRGLRRRAVRAHQRPARIGRHRAHARGRQRAAQHRRGRHRPGQRTPR